MYDEGKIDLRDYFYSLWRYLFCILVPGIIPIIFVLFLETELIKIISITDLIGCACLFLRFLVIVTQCPWCVQVPIIGVGGQNPPWNAGPAQGG